MALDVLRICICVSYKRPKRASMTIIQIRAEKKAARTRRMKRRTTQPISTGANQPDPAPDNDRRTTDPPHKSNSPTTTATMTAAQTRFFLLRLKKFMLVWAKFSSRFKSYLLSCVLSIAMSFFKFMPCLSLRFVRFRLRGLKKGVVCARLSQKKNYSRHCDDCNFFLSESPQGLPCSPVLTPFFHLCKLNDKRSETTVW